MNKNIKNHMQVFFERKLFYNLVRRKNNNVYIIYMAKIDISLTTVVFTIREDNRRDAALKMNHYMRVKNIMLI